MDNNEYLYGGYFNFSGEPIRTSLGVLDLSESTTEDPITAVSDEIETFNIYPNPVNKFLKMEIPRGAFPTQVSIFSITGQKVEDFQTILNEEVSIDVSALRPGVYLLRTVSGKKSIYKKFVKN